jgi:hypothetical protein
MKVCRSNARLRHKVPISVGASSECARDFPLSTGIKQKNGADLSPARNAGAQDVRSEPARPRIIPLLRLDRRGPHHPFGTQRMCLLPEFIAHVVELFGHRTARSSRAYCRPAPLCGDRHNERAFILGNIAANRMVRERAHMDCCSRRISQLEIRSLMGGQSKRAGDSCLAISPRSRRRESTKRCHPRYSLAAVRSSPRGAPSQCRRRGLLGANLRRGPR